MADGGWAASLGYLSEEKKATRKPVQLQSA